nr:hypothetical protein [Burkholderia pseudomallei]
MFATRGFFSAPLLMLGAALGLWLAWAGSTGCSRRGCFFPRRS